MKTYMLVIQSGIREPDWSYMFTESNDRAACEEARRIVARSEIAQSALRCWLMEFTSSDSPWKRIAKITVTKALPTVEYHRVTEEELDAIP